MTSPPVAKAVASTPRAPLPKSTDVPDESLRSPRAMGTVSKGRSAFLAQVAPAKIIHAASQLWAVNEALRASWPVKTEA